MDLAPVLPKEEYIEQAYFFRSFRERLQDGQPAQNILEHVHQELLSTTNLPFAVQFLHDELRHSGVMGEAMKKIGHYFTPFQAHVVNQAEVHDSKFTFTQALLVLEREALYRSGEPSPPGLFIYEVETLSRNRLGYMHGLDSMEKDGFYPEDWRQYIGRVRTQLGIREFAELIFARSHFFVTKRRQQEPDYEATFPILFSEKEGKIALANLGKDPMYLFATLQRQLNYPEVPRLPRKDGRVDEMADLQKRVKALETRLQIMEANQTGDLDLSQFYVKPEDFGVKEE